MTEGYATTFTQREPLIIAGRNGDSIPLLPIEMNLFFPVARRISSLQPMFCFPDWPKSTGTLSVVESL